MQNETVEHYLLQCPGYTHKQEILKRTINGELTLASLLASDKTELHLANYIEAMHRFSSKVSATQLARATTQYHPDR
jgi:hypothetical protein